MKVAGIFLVAWLASCAVEPVVPQDLNIISIKIQVDYDTNI